MNIYESKTIQIKYIPVNRPPHSIFSPGLLPGARAPGSFLMGGDMMIRFLGLKKRYKI